MSNQATNTLSESQKRLLKQFSRKRTRIDRINKQGEVFGHISDYHSKEKIDSIQDQIKKIFPDIRFGIKKNKEENCYELYANYYTYWGWD
jgi:hypothetical protein